MIRLKRLNVQFHRLDFQYFFTVPIQFITNCPYYLGTFDTFILRKTESPTGRSGKTIRIVIEAKMRAGRRRKLFRQDESVIYMTSAKTFADKREIC
jgi:hypothetical protein